MHRFIVLFQCCFFCMQLCGQHHYYPNPRICFVMLEMLITLSQFGRAGKDQPGQRTEKLQI